MDCNGRDKLTFNCLIALPKWILMTYSARECVKNSKEVKYVLHDGKNTYKLSDQKTPEQFAAQKVKVTGTLFPKTGVIKVDKIEAAK
jgi:hypothetical protein